MNLSRAVIAIAAFAIAVSGGTAPATAGEPSPTYVYSLVENSEFQYGCFDPCACPILVRSGMRGRFLLTPSHSDPMFQHYTVSDVTWIVPGGDNELNLTGGGTYLVGGEFAVQHQLVLDLSIDGGAPRHFDSGLVSGGGNFPVIDIQIALHGAFCFDTVLAVHAKPTVVAVDPGSGMNLLAARPNPFSTELDVRLTMPSAGPVDVRVYDVQGHEVRTLAADRWLEAGTHPLIWNGQKNDGGQVAPGLYFIRAEATGREHTRSVALVR